jgi:predicted MFS family arabinose efflux permease
MAVSWSGMAMLVALPRDSRFAVPLIRVGTVLLVLGMIGVAIAVPARLPVLLAICQVLNGSGFGVGWGYLNQAVAMSAPTAERDLASALVPTTQSAGYAIGAAVAGLVANASGYSGALASHGSAAMAAWIFGVGAAIATASVVASFRVRRVA